MLEFFYNCPKKVLQPDIMEYNPFQTPEFNSEALHA